MRIQLNNLKKCFGEHTAVDIQQFTINDGEVLGLVGNNGAGKTTLFRLMLDLAKATEGNVIMIPNKQMLAADLQQSIADPTAVPDEIDPAKSEDWKLLTGAFIDNSFLIDFLTAEEYFEFVGKVSGMTKEQVNERLEAFKAFMSDEIMGQKKYIRDFSAGNKQKIGIVAALLNSPQLRSTGSTVIVSSHNLQHTVDISTRVALLEKGEIIEDIDNSDGKAEEILDKYFNV